MNIEEQIKQFFLKECEKYKNEVLDDETNLWRQMHKEYDAFFTYEIRKQLDELPLFKIKELESYAVELSKDFKDKGLAHSFWYYFIFIMDSSY